MEKSCAILNAARKNMQTAFIQRQRALPYDLKIHNKPRNIMNYHKASNELNIQTHDNDTQEYIVSKKRTFSQKMLNLDKLRMGKRLPHLEDRESPLPIESNIELLKIPTFFHLTPTIVKKQCESLKKLMTPWPKNVPNFPLRIKYTSYLYSGPSLEHPHSNKVEFEIIMKNTNLDDSSKLKLILLCSDNFNVINENINIPVFYCPTRQQNIDYGHFLISSLINESKKLNDIFMANSVYNDSMNSKRIFSTLNCSIDPIKMDNHIKEISSDNIADITNPENNRNVLSSTLNLIKLRPKPTTMIIDGLLYEFNECGYPFLREFKKLGIVGPPPPNVRNIFSRNLPSLCDSELKIDSKLTSTLTKDFLIKLRLLNRYCDRSMMSIKKID